jgi:hypothetical protein
VFLGADTTNKQKIIRVLGLRTGFTPPGIPPLCQLMGCGWGVGMWRVGAGARSKTPVMGPSLNRTNHPPGCHAPSPAFMGIMRPAAGVYHSRPCRGQNERRRAVLPWRGQSGPASQDLLTPPPALLGQAALAGTAGLGDPERVCLVRSPASGKPAPKGTAAPLPPFILGFLGPSPCA